GALSVDAAEFSAPASIHSLVARHTFCPAASRSIPPGTSSRADEPGLRRRVQSSEGARNRPQHRGNARTGADRPILEWRDSELLERDRADGCVASRPDDRAERTAVRAIEAVAGGLRDCLL